MDWKRRFSLEINRTAKLVFMNSKIFIFQSLFFGIVFLSSCAELTKNLLKDPEVKILDLQVPQATSENVQLNLKLNIFNPNAIPLKVGKISYQFNFSDAPVTEGLFEQGIDIPAFGSNNVTIPLNIKFNSIGNLVQKFLKKSLTQDYNLKGTVDVGFITIPFSKQGQIDLAK